MLQRDVVIVEAVRSPIGRKKGGLRETHPVNLATHVLTGLMERAQVDKELVEDVIMGCVTPIGEQGGNIARLSLLNAGFPVTVPGVQLNRMCGSAEQAIHFATQAIKAGDMEIVVAGGVESMTRVPMGSDFNQNTYPAELFAKYPFVSQGISAEIIAEKWGLTREELDRFSYESHLRAIKAISNGYYQKEIIPIKGIDLNGNEVLIMHDEGPRSDTSLEKLGELKSVFKSDGVITAGNSSQISDGAAFLLLMSREKADSLGLKPRAKIVAQSVVGVDPIMMLHGVIPATKKVLAKAKLTLADIDVIEINEAFAPVVLAWAKEFQPDMTKVNPNGGAIALGHPLGATGAILTVKMLHHLERTGGRFGLQTLCIGHGMSVAMIIEREAW